MPVLVSMEHLVWVDSAYRNTTLFPYSNTYSLNLTNPIRDVSRVELVSAFINTSGLSNTCVFLDILELRTPTHIDARKLGTGGVPSGNTAAGSFALLPLDVSPFQACVRQCALASGVLECPEIHTCYLVRSC